MRLKSKIAIVTGGARGIGKAYCLGLAEEGATIVVADIRDTSETVGLIEAGGGVAIGVKVDVGDDGSIRNMCRVAIDELGGVDVLVNNAALYGDLESGSIETISIEAWDRTMAINLRGPFLTMKAVLPTMRERGGGSIVNVASAAVFGFGGFPHYGASKAGIIGLTRCAAREFGPHNIRVNAIAPGFTMSEASEERLAKSGVLTTKDTARANTALGRLGMPEDIVGTVKFLASDDSAYTTGQTFVVDGGWVMR